MGKWTHWQRPCWMAYASLDSLNASHRCSLARTVLFPPPASTVTRKHSCSKHQLHEIHSKLSLFRIYNHQISWSWEDWVFGFSVARTLMCNTCLSPRCYWISQGPLGNISEPKCLFHGGSDSCLQHATANPRKLKECIEKNPSKCCHWQRFGISPAPTKTLALLEARSQTIGRFSSGLSTLSGTEPAGKARGALPWSWARSKVRLQSSRFWLKGCLKNIQSWFILSRINTVRLSPPNLEIP